ncbi:MAG: dTMP kinase [Rhodospirillales bacterium]
MAADAKFITFEGGEGSGKSTQLARAAGWLERHGIDVLRTREPGGAPSAELIRSLLVEGTTDRWQPVTEVLLHAAARTEHLAATVRPALAAGSWVLSDRFADSTRAYQGYGHGVALEIIDQVHAATTGPVIPDLTLVFDVSVATGLARAGRRAESASNAAAEDRYERMGQAFHDRVRDGFQAIARENPGRCVVIDAEMDEDAVHAATIAAIAERLGVG